MNTSAPLSAAAAPWEPAWKAAVMRPSVMFSEYISQSRQEILSKYLYWTLSLAAPLNAHDFHDNVPLRQALFRFYKENPASFTITADVHSNKPGEPLHMSVTHKMLYTDMWGSVTSPQVNTIHINFWARTPLDLQIVEATCRSFRDGVAIGETTIIKHN